MNLGMLKENGLVGIAAVQCHVTSTWGRRGQGGVLNKAHSPKYNIVRSTPTGDSVAMLAQGAAVLSRAQPMGDQGRSTALDVTDLVSVVLEKFKSSTVHSTDLTAWADLQRSIHIQDFGINIQHGSGAVKINGLQLGSSRH